MRRPQTVNIMDDTHRDDEVAKARSAIKEALGLIVGADEIGTDGAADEPRDKAKVEGDLLRQRASCPSGR